MNNNERKIMEKFRMNVSVINFEEKERSSEKLSKFSMKRRILATICMAMLCISCVTLALSSKGSLKNIIMKTRGLGNGIDRAIEDGYIESPNMNYINGEMGLISNEGEMIDTIGADVKIENFLMDDCNISVEFDFKFDNNIKQYIDEENIRDVELKDFFVKDEENKILYMQANEEEFEKYCKEHNLDYTFLNFDENCYSSGLTGNVANYNSIDKSVRVSYNMYSENYPKSKKLYFSFSKIVMREKETNKSITFKGEWKIEVDVPEKMYNRTSESYRVVSCSDENCEVYSSFVTDTGFEIGVIMNNFEEPKLSEEVHEMVMKRGAEQAKHVEQTYIPLESPYEEIYQEWLRKHWTVHKNPTYVENSNQEKFYSTYSPSRRAKGQWIDENKYDYYETCSMTKNDATDKVKVVIHFYEKEVIIELEKINKD